MGFEKEMNSCMQIIREKCPQFTGEEYYSKCRVSFISATMSREVTGFGYKLMADSVKVGFKSDQ